MSDHIHSRVGSDATWVSDPRSPHVREMLRHRGVPEARFNRLWAGAGTQTYCDACGRLIGWRDVEYELEFREDAQIVQIFLHRDCWEKLRNI